MTAPTPDEIGRQIGSMHDDRQRLLAFHGEDGTRPSEALIPAIDQRGEHLLVADGELRTQNEYVAPSTQRRDRLEAMHEERFDNAPVAYVQTDADGVLLRFNAAARGLLNIDTSPGRSLLLPSLVRAEDRRVIRAVISSLRNPPHTSGATPTNPSAEVMLRRPDGTVVAAVVSARRSFNAGSSQVLLHWEISEADPRGRGTPQVARRPAAAARLLAETAAVLSRQGSKALTLDEIVRRVHDVLPAAEAVAVTLMSSRERADTPASTGESAAACDRLQCRIGEGPCLSAIRDGRPVVVSDIGAERRWPRFAAEAARLGVCSLLTVPLPASRGTIGALTLYSTQPNAFDAEDAVIGQAFATHAGIALGHAELEHNLRTSIETRQEIGQAVGILMERHRLSASTAFELLVQASQRSHVKLRDIAHRVVETGEDPAEFC